MIFHQVPTPFTLLPQHFPEQRTRSSPKTTSDKAAGRAIRRSHQLVPGTKCQVQGTRYLMYPGTNTWYLVPDTRYLVPGTMYQAPCTWNQVPRARYLVLGTWYQVSGSWYQARSNRHQVPGTMYLMPGTKYMAAGARYQVPGTRSLIPGTLYLVPCTSYQGQVPRAKHLAPWYQVLWYQVPVRLHFPMGLSNCSDELGGQIAFPNRANRTARLLFPIWSNQSNLAGWVYGGQTAVPWKTLFHAVRPCDSILLHGTPTFSHVIYIYIYISDSHIALPNRSTHLADWV